MRPDDAELDRLKSARTDLAEQIALAQKNLARAKSDEQYAAVAAEYETLRAEQQKVAAAIAEREANALGTWTSRWRPKRP